MNYTRRECLPLLAVPALLAQQPFQSQTPSTVRYSVEAGAAVVEITNVAYELAGSGIPGRPRDERLVLRKSTRTRQVVDEIGMQASTTIEAWPLGVDPKQKPLYSMTVPGFDPATKRGDLIVISKGVEEVEWWSVYKLGSGERLFDTYVPLVELRAHENQRYAGLEAPPDNAADIRLKAPNVVAVLTYASAESVIREVLITCDDPGRARLFRSYADSSRTVTFGRGALRVTISPDPPAAPASATIVVPISNDDLDVVHSQIPAGLHVTAWKR
ncbi:MAG: hypothetical protein ACRD8O_16595 [Bryobacteraceae bacterium]